MNYVTQHNGYAVMASNYWNLWRSSRLRNILCNAGSWRSQSWRAAACATLKRLDSIRYSAFLHHAYSMICLCCDASLYQFVRTSFFVCFVVKLGYHFGESGNASLCRDSNKLSWLHSNMWTNMLGSFSITVLIVNLFTDASVILISFFFASEPWDLEDLNLSVSWRSKYTRWIIFHGKLLPVIMCTRFLLCGF